MNTRKRLRSLAGVFAATLLAGLTPLAAGAAPAEEMCPREVPIHWQATSYLKPSAGDVTRDPKIITYDGDVSIDGWTSGGTPGVDAWFNGGKPWFRVVLGTMVPLKNVKATVTADEGFTFNSPDGGKSPAGGATPAKYKVNIIDPVPAPTKTSDTLITWDVGAMPGESSLMFGVTGKPDPNWTKPLKITLDVTGTATIEEPCPPPTTEPTTPPPTESTTPPATAPSKKPAIAKTGASYLTPLLALAGLGVLGGGVALWRARKRRNEADTDQAGIGQGTREQD